MPRRLRIKPARWVIKLREMRLQLLQVAVRFIMARHIVRGFWLIGEVSSVNDEQLGYPNILGDELLFRLLS